MKLEIYVDQIVRKLPCSKQEKKEIYAELLDHLTLLAEEFEAEGFEKSAAVQMAIEQFGSADMIRAQLRAAMPLVDVYRRRLLLYLLFGYVLLLGYLFLLSPAHFQDRAFIVHRKATLPEYSYVFQNLVPFHTMKLYMTYFGFQTWFVKLAGNVLIYVPLGLLLPLLFSSCRYGGRLFLWIYSCSFLIATLKYVFALGRFDVDTVILNSLGGVVGFWLYKLCVKYKIRMDRQEEAKSG